MPQQRIPAVFMRGGTSKAVIFHARDLPADRSAWDAIFLQLMGSPDPSMRQLDGMGGGVSSLSKVCIIGPATRPDADVDYTFAQIGIDRATVDYSGNCGNMSGAVGPFAVDEGLVPRPLDGQAVVRIHNTNTGKIIVSRFQMDGDEAAVAGDLTIDGVSGEGAPVRLEFMAPGGAKTGRLLPTGRAVDVLEIPTLGRIPVTMVDAANPCVFVDAAVLGQSGTDLPAGLERNTGLLAKLDAIRLAASVAMGLAPDIATAATIVSVPKVAMVSRPAPADTLSGRKLAPGDMDIAVRMISVGQPHRAVPVTGATCLAIATRIPGSVPAQLSGAILQDRAIRIAQPSGVTVVDARVVADPAASGGFHAEYGAVYRTARRLFEGRVLYRAS
jgi:2-methylaconitate cis-trans-isomerase PrpF